MAVSAPFHFGEELFAEIELHLGGLPEGPCDALGGEAFFFGGHDMGEGLIDFDLFRDAGFSEPSGEELVNDTDGVPAHVVSSSSFLMASCTCGNSPRLMARLVELRCFPIRRAKAWTDQSRAARATLTVRRNLLAVPVRFRLVCICLLGEK